MFPADWSDASEAEKNLECRLKILSNASVPLEKTVLFGFSQGGAMAIATGVNLPLAGLIYERVPKQEGFQESI